MCCAVEDSLHFSHKREKLTAGLDSLSGDETRKETEIRSLDSEPQTSDHDYANLCASSQFINTHFSYEKGGSTTKYTHYFDSHEAQMNHFSYLGSIHLIDYFLYIGFMGELMCHIFR